MVLSKERGQDFAKVLKLKRKTCKQVIDLMKSPKISELGNMQEYILFVYCCKPFA